MGREGDWAQERQKRQTDRRTRKTAGQHFQMQDPRLRRRAREGRSERMRGGNEKAKALRWAVAVGEGWLPIAAGGQAARWPGLPSSREGSDLHLIWNEEGIGMSVGSSQYCWPSLFHSFRGGTTAVRRWSVMVLSASSDAPNPPSNLHSTYRSTEYLLSINYRAHNPSVSGPCSRQSSGANLESPEAPSREKTVHSCPTA